MANSPSKSLREGSGKRVAKIIFRPRGGPGILIPPRALSLTYIPIEYHYFHPGAQVSVKEQFLPWLRFHKKTLFHELAHIELGHTFEADFEDSEMTPRNLREIEAEAVACFFVSLWRFQEQNFVRDVYSTGSVEK